MAACSDVDPPTCLKIQTQHQEDNYYETAIVEDYFQSEGHLNLRMSDDGREEMVGMECVSDERGANLRTFRTDLQ